MAKEQPRIKRGSQSYHRQSLAEKRASTDYKPGATDMGMSQAAKRAKRAQIKREAEASQGKKAKAKRQRIRKGYRAERVAAQGGPGPDTDKKIHMAIKKGAEKGKSQSDASKTPGERRKPRTGLGGQGITKGWMPFSQRGK